VVALLDACGCGLACSPIHAQDAIFVAPIAWLGLALVAGLGRDGHCQSSVNLLVHRFLAFHGTHPRHCIIPRFGFPDSV
jgi:hypothetical protein